MQIHFNNLLVAVSCAAFMLAGSMIHAQDDTPKINMIKYAIAIHGGAGPSSKQASDEANKNRVDSMQKVLEIGKGILAKGGTSLDAVEAVVMFMEDDPKFNAGKGAVYTTDGIHELDASIMDGSDKSCGAVAGVQTVKNPIHLRGS